MKKIIKDRRGQQSDAFAMPCNVALSSAKDRFGQQSDAFAMPCSMALSSAQDRHGFLLLLCWALYLVHSSWSNLYFSNYSSF